MKHSVFLISFFTLPLLTQCSSLTTPPANAVTGPFDSRGNYVEAWADSPDKWHRPSAPANSPSAAPTLVTYEPTNQPVITAAKPKPNISPSTTIKPQRKTTVTVAAKPKPKPKPAVVRYTIKRGDTLGRIASNQGVSLTALRRANGISGDIIHPGRTLTIPK